MQNGSRWLWIILITVGCTLVYHKLRECGRENRTLIMTNTVWVTNYGAPADKIVMNLPMLRALTNVTELTNQVIWRVVQSNTVTNIEHLTLTNIVEVFADYSGFMESPFLFRQNDSLLEVSLYKRSATYEIERWHKVSRHHIALYYPFALSYHFSPFTDINPILESLTVGGLVGYSDGFVWGLGLGIRF